MNASVPACSVVRKELVNRQPLAWVEQWHLKLWIWTGKTSPTGMNMIHSIRLSQSKKIMSTFSFKAKSIILTKQIALVGRCGNLKSRRNWIHSITSSSMLRMIWMILTSLKLWVISLCHKLVEIQVIGKTIRDYNRKTTTRGNSSNKNRMKKKLWLLRILCQKKAIKKSNRKKQRSSVPNCNRLKLTS